MNLSDAAKQWFADLGSSEIWKLEYRCGFTFIGTSGRTDAHEKRARDEKEQVAVTAIFDLKLDAAEAAGESYTSPPLAVAPNDEKAGTKQEEAVEGISDEISSTGVSGFKAENSRDQNVNTL